MRLLQVFVLGGGGVSLSLGALRRDRRLPPVEPTSGLDQAVSASMAAHLHWLTALAHLVIAGRVAVGDGGGASWARGQLRSWIDELSDDALDALADELVAERDEMRPKAVAA